MLTEILKQVFYERIILLKKQEAQRLNSSSSYIIIHVTHLKAKITIKYLLIPYASQYL